MTKVLKKGNKVLKLSNKVVITKPVVAGHNLMVSVMRFGLNSNFYYSTDSGTSWTTITGDTTIPNITSVQFKIVAGSSAPGNTVIRDLSAEQDLISAEMGETKESSVVVLTDDKLVSCMEQPEL